MSGLFAVSPHQLTFQLTFRPVVCPALKGGAVKRSYRDRDYSFGQMILNLRSAIGLTQTGLAEHLGISRFAVGEWEAGNKYPKAEHLKTLVDLAVRQDAFSAGHEADEIRALWKAARPKVLLDEQWLSALLTTRARRQFDYSPRTGSYGTRVDWGDALAIPNFYGRDWELNLLTTWVVEKRCHIVTILGLGGIGKSALAVKAMRLVAEHFEVVIWRSLRDAPSCETLLDNLLQVLDPSMIDGLGTSLEQRLSLLLSILRNHRVLLVLDNLEAILEEKVTHGQMRSGYEGYGTLLRRIAETEHQSCLLLTSREKPGDLAPLEGTESPVRSLRLTQLDASSCQQLLSEKGITGDTAERAQLIERYAGNPLALKIVSQTIVDLFDGKIAPFLQQGEIIYGGVHELLIRQFSRLSPLEQRVMIWLAILREPATLSELSSMLVTPVQRMHLLEAMDALHRRSLVERGQKPGSFTLQSVVLEYTTAQLISHICSEFEQGRMSYLSDYGLELAQVHEYIRQVQQRLILSPILTHLHAVHRQQVNVEKRLLRFLDDLRTKPDVEQGYAPANIVALLRTMRGHLRGVDLSHLLIRASNLQETDMQDCKLTNAQIRDCIFTQSFDSIQSLVIDGTGQYWAIVSYSGDVRLYEAGGQVLYRSWRVENDWVNRIGISLDGQMIAGGTAGRIHVWDVTSGELKWSSERDMSLGVPYRFAFSPDGHLLAIGTDAGTYLCTVQETLLTALQQSDLPQPVGTVAWRSDGTIIASGDVAGSIRMWSFQGEAFAQLLMTIDAHDGMVAEIAFSPDGDTLVSASWDGTVKLWRVADGAHIETLVTHQNRVQRVAWSPDSSVIAYSVYKEANWLWDVEQHQHRAALLGNKDSVRGLVFTPDSRQLVSGGDDGTMRVWDTATGACLRIIHGYLDTIWDIEWSPDGTRIVTTGTNMMFLMFMLDETVSPRSLPMNADRVGKLAWSPDGRYIATNSPLLGIQLWDGQTGEAVDSFSMIDPIGYALTLAWSPNGEYLAIGVAADSIHIFNITTHQSYSFGSMTRGGVETLKWSPDGKLLAAYCEGGAVRIWEVVSSTLLDERKADWWTLAWSNDSTRLALIESSSNGNILYQWNVTSGEKVALATLPDTIVEFVWMHRKKIVITASATGVLRWWDEVTGICLRQVQAHQNRISMLKLSADETMLATTGDEGGLWIWDARSGDLLKVLRADRPYERMDITGIRGLTDAQKITLRQLGAIENNSV